MIRSLTLGQIQDIDIRVHPTFALVPIWVFFQWGRDGAGAASIVFGLVLVGGVFGCVMLHELGHSFMARQFGIRVLDITLLPFGGAARIEQVPSAPRSEVLIALAGPAINVAIAAALLPLLLLFGIFQGLNGPRDYVAYLDRVSPGGLLIYLFATNIMIVLFNLLPAFPMDGGRVLRAGLSLFVGRERGTRVAVIVGFAMAVVMAGFGLWLGDYVLPLVAIFIVIVAQAEGRSVRLESAMRRLRVGQFALWDMGGISPDRPLAHALRGGPRDLVVTKDGRVEGMLWRHHLLRELNRGDEQRRVAEVMVPALVVADVDESVYDVQQRMNQHNTWAVPITEDGQYRGIFTADRFVHVYRQITPRPLTPRTPLGFAGSLTSMLRARLK